MKQRAWQTKIKKACKEAGTYKPFFDPVIATLAGIMAKRDEIEEIYNDQEEDPVVEFTNKGGSTNKVKNPLLVMWDDFNKSALNYWRDLGLTPAGLKKINETSFKKSEQKDAANSLIDKLKELRDQ